jgi:hypothetical protein
VGFAQIGGRHNAIHNTACERRDSLVSFAANIRSLFRPIDIGHMKRADVELYDYDYMSDPADNYQQLQVIRHQPEIERLPDQF